MLDALQRIWWLFPLLMCLVLTGIHGYLGIHVLMRKVIFVDLAMAQIAALGAAYAVFLGYEPRDEHSALPMYLFSLGFTLAGAAVFALTRMRREKVPHEALIGIAYAGAGALALLILAKSAGEGDQIKHMLAGSLLTVRWEKVAITAGIYAVIGAFHWIHRRKFFLISTDPELAEKEGISVRFWDFLFYVTFGIVITSSVSIAGVLLVFSFLVVPAVIAVLFLPSAQSRVLCAWGVGAIVSVLGMTLSWYGDLPTGPSVVAGFVAALLLAGAVHYVTTHERSGVAAGRLAAVAGIVALALWGTRFLRHEEHHAHEADFARFVEALQSDDPIVVLDGLHHLEETKDPHAVPHVVELLRRTRSDQIVEHCAHALAILGSSEAVAPLREAAARDVDDDLRVKLAQAILDLRDAAGLGILLDVIEKGQARVPREEARRLFEARTGRKAEGARAWWTQRGASVRWREQTKRFE